MQAITQRSAPGDVRDFRFVRGGTVDVAYTLRLYDERGVRVGASSGNITGTVATMATLLGSAIPDGAMWASVSLRSTGAATTVRYECGVNPDANSEELPVEASTGAWKVYTFGRRPLA